jgi:hypothetical protein
MFVRRHGIRSFGMASLLSEWNYPMAMDFGVKGDFIVLDVWGYK